ncbi:MAG: hypothetical protein ACO3ZK_12985, partial [Rubrivivax sp.]
GEAFCISASTHQWTIGSFGGVRPFHFLFVRPQGTFMSQTKMQHTRRRVNRIYGVGIAIFTLGIGSITLLALFLAQLKLD